MAIVGLGYVGLPLAVLAAQKGWQVTGVDVSAEKVALINAGEAPVVDAKIAAALASRPIQATTDPAAVAEAAVIVIAVPTPVHENHQPDLTPLTSALASLVPHLKAGHVLIIESTINPGVMDEVVVPLLGAKSKIVHLAHCPERINPGDPKWTVANIPRVIGAYTPEGLEAAHAFYSSILTAPIKKMRSVTEAEAVKILENTFRDVNIAFINEMAKSFAKLDIDIMHVIEGATTKPFAFMAHYPGNGVGGHCISVDPYYMIERGRQAGFDHEFLKLARSINDSMPAYAVAQLEAGLQFTTLPTTTPIAVLGLAYKKNIDDIRESPAVTIRRLLEAQYQTIRIFDPYLPKLSTVASLDDAIKDGAAIMLATDHDAIVQELTLDRFKRHNITLIVDGKNALPGPDLAAVGIAYYGIGRRYLPSGGSDSSA